VKPNPSRNVPMRGWLVGRDAFGVSCAAPRSSNRRAGGGTTIWRWLDFCSLFLGLALCSLAESPAIDFIHVSDTHLMDLRGAHPRLVEARKHYAPATDAFRQFLTHQLRTLRPRPSFVIHTGDVVDAFGFEAAGSGSVRSQVEMARRLLSRSPVPLFVALGNHDLQLYRPGELALAVADQSVAGLARARWIRAFDCFQDGTYYAFQHRVGARIYQFVVLDNGYRGAGQRGLAAGGSTAWLAAEQLHWLAQLMAACKDHIVVVALHIPLGEDDGSRPVRDTLAKCPGVALVLAGHIHSEALEPIRIGGRQVLQVRSGAFALSPSNWRRIRLSDRHIELFEVGNPGRVIRTLELAPAGTGVVKAQGH